jgi:uncharacterized protein (UPF0332 family)
MDPFDDCIKKGRIKKIEPDIERVARELETARGELERGRTAYLKGNWTETVTQAYFAMSRCSRAAVNARGYRDTNLFGLCSALQRLLVDTEELPANTVKRLREAKDLKDMAFENHRASPRDARRLLDWAQTFAKTIFTRLALPGLDGETIATDIPQRPDPMRDRAGRFFNRSVHGHQDDYRDSRVS